MRSLPPDYFETLYARDPDPWDFETSTYEAEKYARTLDALMRTRYASALEIGCSIGVLTHLLGDRCDTLLAVDIAEAPLTAARQRCKDQPWIKFERRAVPRDWPVGAFDLILISEVLYYLSSDDVRRLARCLRDSLSRGGEIVLVHWTGDTDYPLPGDEAAELLISACADFASVIHSQKAEIFRLDVLRRDPLSE